MLHLSPNIFEKGLLRLLLADHFFLSEKNPETASASEHGQRSCLVVLLIATITFAFPSTGFLHAPACIQQLR